MTYHEVLSADRDGIRKRFDALHQRHYGQNAEHRPVEIVNIRASAIGKRAKMEFKPGERRRRGREANLRAMSI